ncbi:hypothetical protein GALMADRAFT_253447 [Galerina marginata CBS 339.88]|uniref:Uncharacterized protein n=1 Tax=Galerina marginata (strain CBS 339.88) TaxID=685588 RepID=A0A067SLE3_GALM3|nr:hypothetical protein GALMADRAFT_253447 [Galerina marginata CBS 339.88]
MVELVETQEVLFIYFDVVISHKAKDDTRIVVSVGLIGFEANKAVHNLETISVVRIVNFRAYTLSRQLGVAPVL